MKNDKNNCEIMKIKRKCLRQEIINRYKRKKKKERTEKFWKNIRTERK